MTENPLFYAVAKQQPQKPVVNQGIVKQVASSLRYMFFWGKYLLGEQKKNPKPKHKLLCKQ